MSRGRGRVAEFDDHKGYGWIESVDDHGAAGPRLFFHCTGIADGTRTIATGASVTFDVVDGRLGPEATAISPSAG